MNLFKDKYIKINNYKVYKNPILLGLLFISIMLISLLFQSTLEVGLSLGPDLTAIESVALQVHFVDVGQGDATLIRFPNNKTMIIDAGPTSAKEKLFNYIDNVFFHSNENKTFDYALLTHSDIDHSGNMLQLLNSYKVNTFYRPKIYSTSEQQQLQLSQTLYYISQGEYYNTLINKVNLLKVSGDMQVVFSEAGIVIGSGLDNYLTFLTPNVETYDNSNDFSPIVMLEYETEKIMLTGDATTQVENEAINNNSGFNNYFDVDVLKLGHHGSSTSTSLNFLEAVTPEYAVISVGTNSYGLPSQSTIDNIYQYSQDTGYDLLNNTLSTIEDNNIVFYINSGQEVDYLYVDNVNDYLFIKWWVIVVVGIISTIIVVPFIAIKHIGQKASNV